MNADTLKQLNLEMLTGKGSRLDFDQNREDSRKRLETRYKQVSPAELNQFQNAKTLNLRQQ